LKYRRRKEVTSNGRPPSEGAHSTAVHRNCRFIAVLTNTPVAPYLEAALLL
jgi:hypothetical protein